MADVSVLNFGDGGGNRNIKDASSVRSIKVHGVSQTVTNNAVDLNIYDNMITDTNWTAISALYS